MLYVGSKNRLSKELAPIIQSYIDRGGYLNYLEPFVGGANMIDKIKCQNKYGSDSHRYLIALLKQAQIDTSIFPHTISEQEYKNVKNDYSKYPDWYVGLVGFSSFGGKFFGGYPRGGFKSDGITPRDHVNEIIRNIIKQSHNLKDIKFACLDYQEINNIKKFVIYCDPPYKSSLGYKGADKFDYDKFYNWCKKMAKNNIVLISEYEMPDDFKCIWEKKLKCTISNDTKKRTNRTEKLFIA